jgi:hypothetical protein
VDLELLELPVRTREEAYSFSCMLAELENLRRKGRQKEQTEASSRQVSLDSDDSLDSLLSSDDYETASREDKRKRKRLTKKHRTQRAQKIELTPSQVPSKHERLIAADSTVVDPDELLIASEATDFLNSISPEILNELSQQLTAEVAEPAAVAANDWEELNPTFTTFNLDDTAIGDLTDLPEGVGVLDGEEESVVDLLLPSSDEVDKEPESGPESPVSTAAEAVVGTMDVFEAEKCPDAVEDDVSSLEPVRVRRKVWIQRTAVPVDESRPLIPQLQSIRGKIGGNLMEGDISDQFPSLLGQEQVRLLVTWRDEFIPPVRRIIADMSIYPGIISW